MDEERFQEQLAAWQTMPGRCEEEGYLARSYPSPLDAKFDALCALYLLAEPAQRTTLSQFFALASGGAGRRAAALRSDNLLNYIRRLAWRLTSAEAAGLAHLGLAAVALAAAGADERDILEAGAFLKYASNQARVELAPPGAALAATEPAQAQRLLTALCTSDDATIARIVRYHQGTG